MNTSKDQHLASQQGLPSGHSTKHGLDPGPKIGLKIGPKIGLKKYIFFLIKTTTRILISVFP